MYTLFWLQCGCATYVPLKGLAVWACWLGHAEHLHLTDSRYFHSCGSKGVFLFFFCENLSALEDGTLPKFEGRWKRFPKWQWENLNFLKKNYLFLETGEGREKGGRETSMCGCLLCGAQWGPGLQPRYVPWLGIEPVNLWFAAHAQSIELHQPGQNLKFYCSNNVQLTLKLHRSTYVWIFFFFFINVQLALCIPRFHVCKFNTMDQKEYFWSVVRSLPVDANCVHCHMPFYVRHLSTCGFWYPWAFWNQFPMDTKGWLKFWGSQKLNAGFPLLRDIVLTSLFKSQLQ